MPHELTDEQREFLVKDFVREQITRKGMVADVNIHAPGGEGDDRNYHAHILVTMREIGPDGFGPKEREWNNREQVAQWREKWEHMANKHLERHGHDARIDRRSLEAQGIDREPTTHRGPHLDAIERRGIEPDITRQEADSRRELAELRAALSNITRDIEAERNEARTKTSEPANDNQIELLKQKAEERRIHFARLLTDPEYSRDYRQQQAAALQREEEQRLPNDDRSGDWTERGGMVQQQEAALDYAKRVQGHATGKTEGERGSEATAEAPANLNEMSDAALSGQEAKDRQRETHDQREKSDRDQVFQFVQSVTGRDFRQR